MVSGKRWAELLDETYLQPCDTASLGYTNQYMQAFTSGWVDRDEPGVFVDGGAYGAIPWLDLPRDYGAIIILESSATLGRELLVIAKPRLDAVFDETGAGS